jgi:hypothetical protein
MGVTTFVSWLWWAPLGAAALHIGEEFVYPGGFASWDREYRPSIKSSITPGLHLVVNTLLLVACASIGISGMPDATIVVGGLRLRSPVPASLSVPAWLTLAALLFSNAMFHLVGTYQTKRVSPGVRTGLLLYVPVALVGYWYFLRAGQVSAVAAAVAALLGGSYHLWASLAHGWRSRRREA